LVLVSGEAGAGKTRLVTEFARSVHQQGAAVLFGSCTQHGSVPYEPFAAALAHLVERADQTLLQEVLPAENAELTRLIPTHTGSAPAPLADDPDAERFRLFAAMARALNTLAHHRPVLLALDDLHWGSHSSLQLLAYLVHVPGLARVCLVASYRSSPGDISEGLKVVLPELRRQRGVTPLVLRGLDREGVRRFVEGVTGQSDSTLHPVSDLLTAHTGGNAFLVGELWRHLVETGHVVRAGHQWRIERTLADVTSPESVRDVVKTRVDRLPTETAHLLGMAAVLGTHFAIGVLADAAQLDVRQVLQALEPALASGLLEEAGSGGLRFTHTLVRQAMVEALTPSARCNHHLRVARALEAHLSERAAPEIAHHLAAAVPLVAPAEAVAAARCAARLAMCSAAYDDAATYLAAVEPMVESNRHRAELLLELANARMRSGDVAAALAHCLESRQLAVRLAAPGLFPIL
jgi:predicted ATPase